MTRDELVARLKRAGELALSDPQGVAVDSRGNVVVDETGTANNRLDRIACGTDAPRKTPD
jgi:hypothetical protein